MVNEKLIQRYKDLFGDGWKIIQKMELRQSIRVNTLKMADDKQLISRLEKEGAKFSKVPFLPHGYYVDSSRFSLGAAPEYLFGYYYIQEAASQLPALILNPDKKDIVLDMAAAPGGKLTQLAELMENQGVLIGLEKMKHRIPSLRNSIERLGVSNSVIYNLDALDVSSLGLKFDKILLDAPCSGNFLVDNTWFDKRTVEQFKDRSELQKSLLKAASSVLKEGGTLVYSTCSMEPEENEFVVDWVIENLDLKIEKINPEKIDIGESASANINGKSLNKDVSCCLRIWPHKTKTQPFFIAKFRK
ncbi:MAG: RsmB/NOP family class I SAM-dependent RNA methyltransferase [Nanoarchaeota archaeon]|nr:RsmB/NOP family class I SAM-dependent RNA methyltransferase [Nanoarchaeota archaeon]